MNNIKLHYNNQDIELCLFDDFYITCVNTNDFTDDVESILAALQNGRRIQEWINKTNKPFTITFNGDNIPLDKFSIDLFLIENEAVLTDGEEGGYHVDFLDADNMITHDEHYETMKEVKQACADYIKIDRFNDCRLNILKRGA